MRKLKFLLCSLFLFTLICGCSKEKVDTYANVSNADTQLNTGRGNALTVGDVYEYIRNNMDSDLSKSIIKDVMQSQLDLQDSDYLNLYVKYLNDYFKSTFVDNDTYKFYGNFDETLVVNYLRSEMYDIKCGEGYNSGVLDNTYFSCDYSDYIEKEVVYDVYLKMLKVKYILNEKETLIDKSMARRINYYSVSRSSSTDYTTRENLEGYVRDIEANYASTDETLVRSVEDVAELNRKEDLNKIANEFEKISKDDTSFTYLNKYTTCGNVRCTIEEGKEYQENLVMDKEYYVSKVVTKNNTDVLYESARNLLFSKDVEENLYQIGDDYFLVSPEYGTQGESVITDIILFDGSSTYYLVTVDVIDSDSDFADKVLVAEMLLDSISDIDIFKYCFEKSEMEIYDKQIREYFVKMYGEY